jgi:hypothetical protein
VNERHTISEDPPDYTLGVFRAGIFGPGFHYSIIILGVRIHWVDMLSWHLDYDQATRTLSLFRFPSFCVATLRSRGALYSFASSARNSPDPRASYDEITDILNEVLLSFRLLFGQSKSSRAIFRRLHSNVTDA